MANIDYYGHILENVLSITRLISLFYFRSPSNFSFAGETHDFWEFIYIDKGQMLITAGGQQYQLRAGELAFHCPGEFHAVQACSREKADFIVCAFASESPCMSYFTHKILLLDAAARAGLQAALREVDGSLLPAEDEPPDFPGTAFGSGQLVRTSLEQMLIRLYRQGHAVKIQQRALNTAPPGTSRALAERIQAFLEDHVQDRLTLSEVAAAMGCSVAQVKKAFKAATGASVIDQLIELKISEARRMVAEGELNFTQIALRLGYDNPHYFSRLFRSRQEMTMTEYARSVLADAP